MFEIKPQIPDNSPFRVPNQQIMNFRIKNNLICRIRSMGEGQKTHLGLTGIIPISQQNVYAVKVIRAQKQGVSLGVVDLNSLDMAKNTYKDAIYYGGNGWIENSGEFISGKDRGIKSGYIVKVVVDLKARLITWEVQGKQDKYNFTTGCKNPKLQNNVKWVPYLRINNPDEEVQIL